MQKEYAKVILPLALPWEPWYGIPDGMTVTPGDRVRVSFSGKTSDAVVLQTGGEPDIPADKIQDILGPSEGVPPVSDKELALWRFVSDYYLCPLGVVYRAAYPDQRREGERIALRKEERERKRRDEELAKAEARVARLRDRLSKKDAALAAPHGEAVTARLSAERDAIKAELDEAEKALEDLKKAPSAQEEQPAKKKTVRIKSEHTARLQEALPAGRPVLLSGGPERSAVIIDIVRKTWASGHTVLLLTPQADKGDTLEKVFRKICGEDLLVYHSAGADGDRRAAAEALRSTGGAKVVIGTRSALFLPFTNLGLIVVDDEHDSSYKQDAAPRYNARDCAVVLAGLHGCPVVLSSSTPSFETAANVASGKYGHVSVPSAGNALEVIDTVAEFRKRGMVGDVSMRTIKMIKDTCAHGGKTLLLIPYGNTAKLDENAALLFPKETQRGDITISTIPAVAAQDLSGYGLVVVFDGEKIPPMNDFRGDEKTARIINGLRERITCPLVIQTRTAELPAFNPDNGYQEKILKERKDFGYPPYKRLVDVVVRDNNTNRLQTLTRMLKDTLQPFEPEGPLPKADNPKEIGNTAVLRIRLDKDKTLKEKKHTILETVSRFETTKHYLGHIIIDVDPD